MPLKPSAATKRLEEIEEIQDRIRKLADQYKTDFIAEPNDIDSVVQQDLKTAADSLDFIKGIYKSKNEKR